MSLLSLAVEESPSLRKEFFNPDLSSTDLDPIDGCQLSYLLKKRVAMSPDDPVNGSRNIEKSSGKLVVFEDRKIRRIFHNGEWYFSIIDIVEVLTGSPNPRRYWSNLKIQLSDNEGFIELYPKTVQLKLEAADGKKYLTDTANTETMLRIIQSIPSPKAEPFKRWLAKVGYERIQEIEDPELATQRTREIYKAKGYNTDWIEKRMRSIAIREELNFNENTPS